MKLGEVCLLTEDVRRLADFYKKLLQVENGSEDETHQCILAEETMLTVYHDGAKREKNFQNIQLAFTVEDLDAAYERVRALGAKVVEPPAKRPWGAVNMSFLDPDGNLLFFRSFPEKQP
ncbi:VOC family protein [Neglectibacter caecimuris]|mgnify:CR=1 FL=1|uniref:VOC family protein n=1 Tax=Neglectibacter caecimuris TaxID=3093658 RepID=UPI002AC93088|nr:VOC family protein [Neglectibacter sp. M00184]